MSRRRGQEELQFGSDSFLDVVANIVGILIILIVIAGLRISQTPLVRAKPAKVDSSGTRALPAPSSVPDLPESTEVVTETPRVIVLQPLDEPEPVLPPLPDLVVPQNLVSLTDQLEAEIAEIKGNDAQLAALLEHSNKHKLTLLERQQAIESKIHENLKELATKKKRAAKAEADLDLAKETLARLTQQVSAIESVPENIEALEHRITPISREVNGKEKHYRLEKNTVVEVPLEELVTRFRAQLERRKDWLAKTRQHQGKIGPVDGFTMMYLVRVNSLPDIGSGRSGYGGFSINLVRFEIHPEPDVRGESEEVALRKGSRFYQSILGTGADTTLTFWVYPDSYSIYRKLQKFAHEHGYAVAGRPLPKGYHIAGSPEGSKSASE